MSSNRKTSATALAPTSTSRRWREPEASFLRRERRYGYLALRRSFSSLGSEACRLESWRRFTKQHPWLIASGVLSLGAITGVFVASLRSRNHDPHDQELSCVMHQEKRIRRVSWLRSGLASIARIVMFRSFRRLKSELDVPSSTADVHVHRYGASYEHVGTGEEE